LYDQIGSPAQVDLWDILENFYGLQLVLVLAEPHSPTIDSRLKRFLQEFHPASSTLLLGLKTVLPLDPVLTDEYGNLLVAEDNVVDDDGNLLLSAGEYLTTAAAGCATVPVTYSGFILSYAGLTFAYKQCLSD
jgi:hypothetical protein